MANKFEVEIIDNRGDTYKQLLSRASAVKVSMDYVAKRNRENYHTGARVAMGYCVDPVYSSYNDECDLRVISCKVEYMRLMRQKSIRAGVIIIHNYAIELLVADE